APRHKSPDGLGYPSRFGPFRARKTPSQPQRRTREATGPVDTTGLGSGTVMQEHSARPEEVVLGPGLIDSPQSDRRTSLLDAGARPQLGGEGWGGGRGGGVAGPAARGPPRGPRPLGRGYPERGIESPGPAVDAGGDVVLDAAAGAPPAVVLLRPGHHGVRSP